MSNRWQMNRIGFVNFWLYEEQIFELKNGKILIRGTNGSGKSVTTQSIVGFILDGDRSPAKLDPFGSKDKKMEYYFLGDGEKEDETGYIFLEFKRKYTEQYITIGIGQRAQKGKQMSFWGFVLKDGRRIGIDFKLYKEIGSRRIPFSKSDLTKELGDKNPLVQSQREYMELVNREIFGYKDGEQYKKLIKVLLKIRASKLSRDVKPEDVYKILNDSLSVLEEEDLRILVEGLEKMDTMQDTNERQKKVLQSLGIIKREYDKYNRFILEKKALAFYEAENTYKNLEKRISQLKETLKNLQGEEEDKKREKTELEERTEKIEAQIKLLESFDLKKSVAELQEAEREIKNISSYLGKNREKLEENGTKIRKNLADKREEERERENIIYQIEKEYRELEEINRELRFEEHLKNRDEILKSDGEELLKKIQNNLEIYHKNILEGLEALKILEEVKAELEKAERDIEKYRLRKDEEFEEREKAIRLEEKARDELVEKFYILKENNEFLKISKEELEKISELIGKYKGTIEAGEINKILEKNYNLKNQELYEEKFQTKGLKDGREKLYQEELVELEKLKNQKETVPLRKQRTIECREMLKKSGVKFIPFYETVDFAPELSEKERDILEMQLADSGILDALIIPYKEQERAKSIIEKYSDIFIYTENKNKANKKFAKLILEEIDEEYKEVVENLLKNISQDKTSESFLVIEKNGYFRNGAVEGYSTGEEKSSFIGVQTRKLRLQQKIKEKEEICQHFVEELEKYEEILQGIENKLEILNKEYGEKPVYDDLDAGIELRKETELRYNSATRELEIEEEKLEKIKRKTERSEQQVFNKCRILPFRRQIAEYEEADILAQGYNSGLKEINSCLRGYWNSITKTEHLEAEEDYLEEAKDRITDEIKREERELDKWQLIKEKLSEFLNRPENIQAAENLDKLMKEKKSFADRKMELLKEEGQLEEQIKNSERQLIEESEKVEASQKRAEETELYFQEELELGYVYKKESEENKNSREYLNEILKKVETDNKEISIVEANRRISKTYENNTKGFFSEYNIGLEDIFEDNIEFCRRRLAIVVVLDGHKYSLYEFENTIREEMEARQYAIEKEDRKIIENILTGNIGHRINDYIYESKKWIQDMSKIMQEMETSMKMKFFMDWKPKKKENEGELEIDELQKLLSKEWILLTPADIDKISLHFREKLEVIKREIKEQNGTLTYMDAIKRMLDYREWFRFRVHFQKAGEVKKELTEKAFNTFSGGERALSIYIPLLAAASAQYKKADETAPRIIALDEAFAGVDEKNISGMFEMIEKLDFDYIMNSQSLWGDYETVKSLRIAELQNIKELKLITVNTFLWNGSKKILEE